MLRLPVDSSRNAALAGEKTVADALLAERVEQARAQRIWLVLVCHPPPCSPRACEPSRRNSPPRSTTRSGRGRWGSSAPESTCPRPPEQGGLGKMPAISANTCGRRRQGGVARQVKSGEYSPSHGRPEMPDLARTNAIRTLNAIAARVIARFAPLRCCCCAPASNAFLRLRLGLRMQNFRAIYFVFGHLRARRLERSWTKPFPDTVNI